MKELTSSEKIITRDLYAGSKSMVELELQAKLHLQRVTAQAEDQYERPGYVASVRGHQGLRTPSLSQSRRRVRSGDYKMDMLIERKVKSEEWGKCFLGVPRSDVQGTCRKMKS